MEYPSNRSQETSDKMFSQKAAISVSQDRKNIKIMCEKKTRNLTYINKYCGLSNNQGVSIFNTFSICLTIRQNNTKLRYIKRKVHSNYKKKLTAARKL